MICDAYHLFWFAHAIDFILNQALGKNAEGHPVDQITLVDKQKALGA